MDYLDYKESEEVSSFFDAPVLHIDHSLSSKEIEFYKNLIFSMNNLQQIYFIDDCDMKTIILFKNLLTISDFISEENIDKYILIKLKKEDYELLINDTYKEPQTWHLPYYFDSNDMKLTDIPGVRLLYSFIKKIKNKNYSPAEQIMKIYDTIKLFDLVEENYDFPKIIKNKKAKANDMNKLFTYILNMFDYKTFNGKIVENNNISNISLVLVDDKKYNLNGIYLFDPSMDTLSKEKYLKEDLRRINYNFFGLNLYLFNRLNYDDKLCGVLSLLEIEDYDYYKEKELICRNNDIIKEKELMEKVFDLSIDEIYQIIKNTKQINIDTIIKINDVLYNDKQEKYNDYIKYNYESRKKELFKKNIDEELEEYIKS